MFEIGRNYTTRAGKPALVYRVNKEAGEITYKSHTGGFITVNAEGRYGLNPDALDMMPATEKAVDPRRDAQLREALKPNATTAEKLIAASGPTPERIAAQLDERPLSEFTNEQLDALRDTVSPTFTERLRAGLLLGVRKSPEGRVLRALVAAGVITNDQQMIALGAIVTELVG